MKKNMSDEKINAGAVTDTGSPATDQGGQAAANAGATNTGADKGNANDGKSEINLDDYVSKTDYEELQKKLGENSSELGGLRSFFEEVHPLLEKLQDQPDVIQAIVSGKLNSELAQAVMEGKIKLDDATQVADAHAQVKQEVGKKEYEKLSPEDITKMVNEKLEEGIKPVIEKLNKSEQQFNKALTDADERHDFENKVNSFIKNTPDYQDFASDIDKWFDEHPEQFDIEVAYYAVKGKQTTAEAMKKAEEIAAEEAKRIAANAGGGQSRGNATVNDPDLVDKLFGTLKNPNSM